MRVLFFRLTAFKKVVSKPNLCEMCLVFIRSIYLLDSIEGFGFEMETFPHLGKPSSTKLFSSQIALNKSLIFKNQLIVSSFECLFVAVAGFWRLNIFLISLCLISDSAFIWLDWSILLFWKSLYWLIVVYLLLRVTLIWFLLNP